MVKLNPDGCTIAVILLLSLFVAVEEEATISLEIEKFPASPFYVEIGKNLTLDVTYRYNGTKSYVRAEWFKLPGPVLIIRRDSAGDILHNDNRASLNGASLVLKNVERKDNVTFQFALGAGDTVDIPTKEINVIVQEQPIAVVNCSQSIIVTEGDDVSCLCDSKNGNPPPAASWSKNGKVIDGYGYLKKNLSLKNVSKENSGNYTCTVRSHNLNDSKSVEIIVKYKPRDISFNTDQKDGKYVNPNSKVTLTCKADAYPAATFTIYYDGKQLAGVTNGVYTINSVNSGHAGRYECEAMNVIGMANSSLVLKVKEKPTAKVCCSSLVVNEGETVTCVCSSIGGNPLPTVSWIKDGTTSAINGIGKLNKTLSFDPINRTDSGTYWCKTESQGSSDEKSINIIARFKPEITSFKSSVLSAPLNCPITITCIADGYPQPHYTLLHNGSTLLENVAEIKYTMCSVSYSNAGKYECRAVNFLANDTVEFNLVVTAGIPKPTTFPTDTATGNSSKTDKSDCNNCGTEWYIIVITLFCGILIGLVMTYIAWTLRRRLAKGKNSNPTANPPQYEVPETQLERTRKIPMYQELNLQDMNKEDNYQPLRRNARNGRNNEAVNENEGGYQELNKGREKGDENYQSLNRV